MSSTSTTFTMVFTKWYSNILTVSQGYNMHNTRTHIYIYNQFICKCGMKRTTTGQSFSEGRFEFEIHRLSFYCNLTLLWCTHVLCIRTAAGNNLNWPFWNTSACIGINVTVDIMCVYSMHLLFKSRQSFSSCGPEYRRGLGDIPLEYSG